MTSLPRRSARTARLAVPALSLGVAFGVLAGCGASDDDLEPDSSPTPTATASPSATESTDSGPEVTPEGTQLAFGDQAVVDHREGGSSTLLGLTVQSATQGSVKDFVGFNLDDPYRKNANYFYVRVQVTNEGDKTVGGYDVPLYGISGNSTLLPIVKFTAPFKKCNTQPLPKRFGPGDRFGTCLVYLSPDKGSLEGVSYRPTEDVEPIEWRGVVKKPADKPKKGDKNQP